MSSANETYSFGFSWNNSYAFDSLNATYLKHQHIFTKNFLWKNRAGNSVERSFFRLMSNYGLSVLDNQEDKDQIVSRLLEYDPYIIPEESDNIPDLTNRIKTFYPLPSLKGGIKVGINYNLSEGERESFEVVQNPSSGKTYSADVGWHLAFPISYLLARNHSIGIEPGLSYTNFKVTEQILDGSQTYKYRMYYAEVPLVYRLSILNPKSGGFAGIQEYSVNLVEKLDAKIFLIDDKINDASTSDLQRLERRKNSRVIKRNHLEMNTPYKRVMPTLILGLRPKFRLSSFIESDNANNITNWVQLDAIAGLGFDWYHSDNVYTIELRYNYGLLNTNSTERYPLGGETSGLLFDDFFVSDDFRIQTIEISLLANFVLNSKAFKIQ
jgi:hypothetical protein